MHTLIGKVNRDAQFGKDPEFRAFYNGASNETMNQSSIDHNNNNNNSNNGNSSRSADKSIVDLDLVVEKWIQYMWETTKSKNEASKYEFENLEIVVNWAKVDLMHDDAKFDEHNKFKHQPQTQTLFKTYFTNQTDQEQEYSFKTERVTRQSCTFSFLKGFSREKDAGITFKLPQEIVEIGGGIRSEQSVECGKDQTKEEQVTWGVDSMIKVQPHSKTKAELVINELELERTFSLETMLKGRLYVVLNHRKENNAFVKSFSGDIVEIFSKALQKGWIPPNSTKFEIIESNGIKMVKSTLSGKCKFRLGVEQHVTLNEEKI